MKQAVLDFLNEIQQLKDTRFATDLAIQNTKQAENVTKFALKNQPLGDELASLVAATQANKEALDAARKSGSGEAGVKAFNEANAALMKRFDELYTNAAKERKEQIAQAFPESITRLTSETVQAEIDSNRALTESRLDVLKIEIEQVKAAMARAEKNDGSIVGQQNSAAKVAALAAKQQQLEIEQTKLEAIKETESYTAKSRNDLLNSPSLQQQVELQRQKNQFDAEAKQETLRNRLERASLRDTDSYGESTTALQQEMKRQRQAEVDARNAVEAKFAERQAQRDALTSTAGGAFVSENTEYQAELAGLQDEIEKNKELLALTEAQKVAEQSRQETIRANLEMFEEMQTQAEAQYNSDTASAVQRNAAKKEYEQLSAAIQKLRDDFIAGEGNIIDYNKQLTELQVKMGMLVKSEELRNTARSVQDIFNDSADNFGRKLDDLNLRNAELAAGFDNVFENIRSGLGSTVRDMVTGTATMGEAFRNFAVSVIDSMLDIAAQEAATGFLSALTGKGQGDGAGSGIAGVFKSIFGLFSGKAAGGLITGGVPNRDSVPIMAMQGEYVLRKSAVDALGVDNLNRINAMTAQAGNSQANAPSAKGGGTVNVYIVPKDSVPNIGPNDILAVVNDDLARGGSTAKLVKTVAMGG